MATIYHNPRRPKPAFWIEFSIKGTRSYFTDCKKKPEFKLLFKDEKDGQNGDKK